MLRSARRSLVLAVLAAVSSSLASCGGAERESTAEGAAAAWRLDPTPRLDVGDREDGDSVVFSGVADARLLPNGLLAVADAGTATVRFFDAKGTLVLRAGRRGRGPGEFTGGMQMMDYSGDSVAIWDPGQTRWTVVSSRTGATRQPSERLRTPVWVHAGVDIRSALAGPAEWVIARIASLSAASPAPRVAQLDETGLLWVRNEADVREWRAYADTGSAIGSVRIPEGERLTHITRDAMVTVALDSLGLERVLVRTLMKGPHAAPVLEPWAVAPVDSGGRARLMSAMRMAVVAQEMYFAEHGHYTAAGDSLQFEMPEGTAFRIIEKTDRGWRGVGYFTATGFSCGMIVGLATPAGWSDFEVRCGW